MLTAAALALILVAAEEGALANGDPASHVLPSREVFVPFDPSLCSAAGRRLDALTEATRKAGYPIKVAVIPTGEDLGTLFRLFGRPQEYARVLASELPRKHFGRYRLLVLMPGRAGLYNATPKESQALRRIVRRSQSDGADSSREALTRWAIDIVSKLSRTAGHRVASPKPKPACPDIELGSPSSSSESGPWGAIGIGAVLVAMLALAWFLGARGRTPRQPG
jgi:hypothetical protein